MKYIILLLSLTIGLYTQAQTITSFPADPAAFLKELDVFMNTTKRDDAKEATDKFLALNKAGKITPDIIAKVIENSNAMLAQKLRAAPHFVDYLTAVNIYAESGTAADVFGKWSSILNEVIKIQRKGSSKEFTQYIEFSVGLFKENAFYYTKSKIWKATSKSYELGFANEKPFIKFASTDLLGISTADTVFVFGTSGIYYPLDEVWNGGKGKVNWEKVGLPADQVYAELKGYTIEMNKADYSVDSVTFYNKTYFDFGLQGSFKDRLTAQKSMTGFPNFVSYRKDLPIKNLGPNIKYLGGFAMEGSQIVGGGDSTAKATLIFTQDNGRTAVMLKSSYIVIKTNDELSANNAEVSIYVGKDSIYHPGLTIKYKMQKRELAFYAGNEGVSASSFYDSYHRQEFNAEAIVWDLNTNDLQVKMTSGAGKNPMVVTSYNYFRKGELDKYQGAMDFNPISVIKIYCDETSSRDFYAETLAKRMNPNYTENTIKRMLYKLVEDGFIYYDNITGIITVKDKVFNFVLSNADKIDYDVIQFNSYSTKNNAVLNLDTFDMTVEGVRMIVLSDSQEVRIFPGDTIDIQLREDQDIAFSNIVMAGIIDFVGEGFYFDYDSFKVDLTDLAAATINVPTGEKDKDGDPVFVPLRSKIEGLTGYLNIAQPDNKAGKKPALQYPIFTNRKKSFVYYSADSIHQGAYTRDSFYFQLDPFQLDSLISFDPYYTDLGGRLVSYGIFPTFDEQLKIQEDLSLGFQRTTPPKGFELYRGKGTYTDSIKLSNTGLRGSGKVDYLFTSFNSSDIIFFPDSLDAVTDSFNMKKTTYKGFTYPLVEGFDNDIHWLPYGDSMYIKMRTVPFTMYEEGSNLKGNLLLTASGLKGDGRFEFKEAVLASTQFNFKSESMSSDTMSMQIKSIGEDRVTFNTPNVSGDVDFVKRQGQFKANDENIPTDFSNNYYKTEINEFFWDMDANILDFKSPEGSAGAYFVSTKSDQDSLKFLGKRGVFDMTSSIIEVTGVPEVRVADASIIPDSGKVVIEPGGLLRNLTNAVVIADTANKSHRLYKADLTIESKKSYKGSGLYDYVYGKTKPQPIFFSNIQVKDETGKRKRVFFKTYADTQIPDTTNFMLNDGFAFKGMAKLEAELKSLMFDGFGKLSLLDERLGEKYWFTLLDSIDPNNALIHYDKVYSDSKDTLTVGVFYNPLDTVSSFYTNLMQPLHNPNDFPTLQVKGILKYDDLLKTYHFGNEERLNTANPYGSTLTYDTKNGVVKAEGKMNFPLVFNPLKLIVSGNMEQTLDSNKFVFTTTIGLDLIMEKDLLEMFARDVIAFSFDKPNADYTTNFFENALSNLMDKNKAKKTIEEMRKTGLFAKPKELSTSLVISEVKLIYDPYYQIFRSDGPITVSYIGESGVHKKLNGYLEFGMRQNNDFFNFYIESTFDDWYYITYNNKTLQIASSKEDFNKLLAAIPAEKRQVKLPNNEFYFYTISSFGAMESFLDRMNKIASGVRVDLDLFPSDDDLMEDELNDLRQQLLEEEEMNRLDQEEEDLLNQEEDGPVIVDPRPKDNTPPPSDEDLNNDAQPKGGKKKKDDTSTIEETDDEPVDEEVEPQPKEEENTIPKEVLDWEQNQDGKKKKKGKDE